jgi:hypothetical protein
MTAAKDAWRTPGHGVKRASTDQFMAHAVYACGTRYTYTGTGPECLTWMIQEKRAGAVRHGYTYAAAGAVA